MKGEIKAVIFDRDGVLVDTEIIHIKSVVQAFKELGIKISEKEKKSIFGRHPEDYKKEFLKKYNFSYKDFRKRQLKIYNEKYIRAKPNKEILKILKILSNNKIQLALTTTSKLKGTKNLLKVLNLDKFFDVIVTFEDTKIRKPSPEPYLKTLQKLNLSAKNCVVIEDSLVGVESAKRAKIKCIAFKTPHIKRKELVKADLITNSQNKIMNYLKLNGLSL